MERTFSIAILEDDELLREMIQEMFNSMDNVKVFAFASGEEFFESYAAISPDIVVTDYHFELNGKSMMTGGEVVKKLYQLNPDLPVIVVSSQQNLSRALELMEYRVIDYVEKKDDYLIRLQKSLKQTLSFMELSDEIEHTQKTMTKDKAHLIKLGFVFGGIALVIIIGELLLWS